MSKAGLPIGTRVSDRWEENFGTVTGHNETIKAGRANAGGHGRGDSGTARVNVTMNVVTWDCGIVDEYLTSGLTVI